MPDQEQTCQGRACGMHSYAPLSMHLLLVVAAGRPTSSCTACTDKSSTAVKPLPAGKVALLQSCLQTQTDRCTQHNAAAAAQPCRTAMQLLCHPAKL
jgi:hypothetical protein